MRTAGCVIILLIRETDLMVEFIDLKLLRHLLFLNVMDLLPPPLVVVVVITI